MNKKELIDFCLSLGPTFADTPFAKMEKGQPTVVMRHLKNKNHLLIFLSEKAESISQSSRSQKSQSNCEISLRILIQHFT